MRIYQVLTVLLILMFSANAKAGIWYHCEAVPDQGVICDLFVTSPDTVSNPVWAVSGNIGIMDILNGGATAVLSCGQGTVTLDFIGNGEPMSASISVSCPTSGYGGGGGSGGGSFSCPPGVTCVRVR